jgi:L-ascorbate metabolism protein UlaG (beta-lactamase superfamily)
MHFATFPLLKGTPEMLEKEMTRLGSKAQMRVLNPGERLDISSS